MNFPVCAKVILFFMTFLICFYRSSTDLFLLHLPPYWDNL